MEAGTLPTILCAWCGATIAKRGPAVSHGMCFRCLRAFEAASARARSDAELADPACTGHGAAGG